LFLEFVPLSVTMAFAWVELVRVIHVLGAVLWAGGALFSLLFIGPAVRAAGETGQKFMQVVQRGGGPAKIMGPVSGVTVLTGFLLYWKRGYDRDPFGSSSTTILTLGALLGTAVFLVGMLYALPMQRRMAAKAKAFGATGPTPEQAAEMGRMGKRMMALGTAVTWLLLLTLVLMVGRNVFA
jgi:uncharacterized membrane protein